MKNKLLSILKIGIFVVLFFVLWNSNCYALNTRYLYDGVYNFLYRESDSVLVKKLVDKSKNQIKAIENFFQIKPSALINIYITRSEGEFQSYSQQGFPEWAQAIAFTNRRIIIIRVANGDELTRLPQVFLHELVHIYLGIRFPDQKIPTWLHEGLAQKLSNENLTINEQVLIANALYGNKLTDLKALDSLFSFSQIKAKTAYALARSAVDFFLKNNSTYDLFKILDLLDHNESIDQAFLQVTGRDFVDFEIGWYSYIDSEYKWMILLNVPDLVWTILVILFIAAFFKIKYKNKKTIRSWPEPESDDMDVV